MGTHTTLPRVKSTGLVLQELADEILIYDTETSTALCLNRPASIVFNMCDGRSTPADACREIASDLDEQMIWDAVEEFRRHNLLADVHTEPFVSRTVSRRTLVKQAAALGIAIPLISALVVPAATNAASTCLPLNANCVQGQLPACCPPLLCLTNANEGHSCQNVPGLIVPLDPNAQHDVRVNGSGK